MKATPILDSIDSRPGGIDVAPCRHCGTKVTRSTPQADSTGELPWWHADTGYGTCGKKGK